LTLFLCDFFAWTILPVRRSLTMAQQIVFDPNLTKLDFLVLQNLAADIKEHSSNGIENGQASLNGSGAWGKSRDEATLAALTALNDPKDPAFEPTVINGTDLNHVRLPKVLDKWVLRPYVRAARSIVRVETDVVMLTHLLLYFATSLPSALVLFWRFSWLHGLLHVVMQFSYMGTYTLMMHQHIHANGILHRRYGFFDTLFPYITDPLMGHTWNSYFFHHVKHHHIEGNGPDDLSSTIRYQRDNIFHLLHYFARFFFLIWFDLPLYFLRKGRPSLARGVIFWELTSYATIFSLYRLHASATFCVLLLPFLLMRLGLMVGNWGQHAFVDDEEPDSDYRSSVTLIDVAVSLPPAPRRGPHPMN
jgi:hypothetical protein